MSGTSGRGTAKFQMAKAQAIVDPAAARRRVMFLPGEISPHV